MQTEGRTNCVRAPYVARIVLGLAFISTFLVVPGLRADDLSDRFDFHGYGYQDYMQTNQNVYLGADKRGNWDNNFLGLVTSVSINDRSKLWVQLEGSSTEGARFTWFFLDYQLTEDLSAHVGRVKFPLGLYNETIDAKFLQVTQLEPSLYQQAADMVHDAYHGVGVDYEQSIGHGNLLWQLYGGNSYDTDPPIDSKDRRMIGGRLTYRTPLPGLRFMLSAYRTQVEELADKTLTNEDRVIASIDFTCSICDVKAEYGTHKFAGVRSNAYYLQGRYSLTRSWAPYVRYDHAVLDKNRGDDPSYFQNTFVVGIQYRIADQLTLRVENHFNHGYALPVASDEVVAGAGAINWNLSVAGLNFSF
jgi:hypothetical protein